MVFLAGRSLYKALLPSALINQEGLGSQALWFATALACSLTAIFCAFTSALYKVIDDEKKERAQNAGNNAPSRQKSNMRE